MKNMVLLLLFSINFFVCAYPQESFLHANALYHDGQYDDAFEKYNSIKNKGRAVWYNLGNTVFKQNKPLDALVYWSRAECGAGKKEHEAIMHNKAHALHCLEKSVEPLTFIQRFFNSVNCSVISWQLIIIGALCFLVVFSYYSQVYGASFLFVFFYAILLFASYGLYYFEQSSKQSYAYVCEYDVPIRTVPHNKSHASGIVSYADKVCIIKNDDEWAKVFGRNIVGWVPKHSLVVI